MNKNAGAYFNSHEMVLQEFLELDMKTSLKTYDFGNKRAKYSQNTTSKYAINRIVKSEKPTRVSEIHYRCKNGDGHLVAIMLVFSDGTTSDFIEDKFFADQSGPVRKIQLDPTKKIKEIEMSAEKYLIYGLTIRYRALLGEVTERFSSRYSARETTVRHEIENESYIVDVKTDSDFWRLGFVCYSPKQEQKKK